jgi:hypothetical protein
MRFAILTAGILVLVSGIATTAAAAADATAFYAAKNDSALQRLGFATQELAGHVWPAAPQPAGAAADVVALEGVKHYTTGVQFVSTSPAEIAAVRGPRGSAEWWYLPTLWVFGAPGAGRAPVYRFSKPGAWRYSRSAAGFAGYNPDGVAFYVSEAQAAGQQPLYIYFRPQESM